MSGLEAAHTVHAGYTVIVPLRRDRVAEASQLLAELREDPSRLPFADSATTHFATVSVIPAQPYGPDGPDGADELPPTLLIATSFSGPARAHVDELVRVAGDGLRELFGHCEVFPHQPPSSDRELARFLRRHRHPDTFYSGMQHLTRDDVLRHDQLRTAIQDHIDERQEAGGFTGSATDIRREIQELVVSRPELAWAQGSWQPAPGSWLALHWRVVVLAAVLLPFLALLLIGSIALVFVDSDALGVAVASGWLAVVLGLLVVVGLVYGVRDAELEQRYVAGRQPDAHVRALAGTQNNPVINEMTIAGPIKEGIWRPLFLRIALWIVARLAEGVPGIRYLRSGITIPTVATARWIATDRGRRLIFISNFTNASEPYVRDFIDVRNGAMRINVSFGFGAGYPKTEWVLRGGALADPNGFIYVVAANQRRTDLWFCPYRHLSIDNIKINRRIREGLFGPCTEDQARDWLQLL